MTATYSFGNLVLGTIGVIGPTRMEYSRVISSMEYLKEKAEFGNHTTDWRWY